MQFEAIVMKNHLDKISFLFVEFEIFVQRKIFQEVYHSECFFFDLAYLLAIVENLGSLFQFQS